MQILKERTEIAKATNFGKYPVICIDVSDRDEYGIRGTKVRIDNGTFDSGDPYFINARIRTYIDENCLTTVAGGCSITQSVSYLDYMEMVEYANTPIIKADQEILVVLYNSKIKYIHCPVILKTGSRVNASCQTPLELEKFEIL